MKEIWKPVPNYEGLYEVSSLGFIRSLKRYGVKNTRILKLFADTHGHLQVSLYRGGEKKFYVHKIVAEVFLGHKTNGTIEKVIDHIDNIKSNNAVSNLQIISHRENASKDRINKTGYVGVFADKRCSKERYYSSLQINKERIRFGSFSCVTKAALLYIVAANHVGEYNGDKEAFISNIKNKFNESIKRN